MQNVIRLYYSFQNFILFAKIQMLELVRILILVILI